MKRLGLNRGAYHGERIDIEALLRDVAALARTHRWEVDDIPMEDGRSLLALRRPAAPTAPGIYLSAGIHGDEPAGPLAIRRLLEEDQWPASVGIWICPCLNPWGFLHNARSNAQGLDLNRDYRHRESVEVRAHMNWLERQPRFDLTLCLHEDWEAQGFYVYDLRRGKCEPLGPRVVAAVSAVCPIDQSAEIDGRPAQAGIIFPSTDIAARPQWPEALYLFERHSDQCLTLEAPSDFSLSTRVEALVVGVRAAIAGAMRD